MEEVGASAGAATLKGALEFQSSMAAAIIQSGTQGTGEGTGDGLRVAALRGQGVGRQLDITV